MCFSLQHLQEIGLGSKRSPEVEWVGGGQRSPPAGKSSQAGCKLTKSSSLRAEEDGLFFQRQGSFHKARFEGD